MHACNADGVAALRAASDLGLRNVVRFLAERIAASAATSKHGSAEASARSAGGAATEDGEPTPPEPPPHNSSEPSHTRPKACARCGKTTPRTTPTLIICARCMAVRYCRRRCQSLHWEAQHRAE